MLEKRTHDPSPSRTRLRLLCVGLACAMLLLGHAALAEDAPDAQREGPYVAAHFIGAFPNFSGDNLFVKPTGEAHSEEHESLGFNLRAGWRFHRYVAAELQYEWIQNFRARTLGATCAHVKPQVLTANLRFIAPFRAVEPYAIVGVGAGRYDVRIKLRNFGQGNACGVQPGRDERQDEWEFAARFGAGLDIHLTRNVAIGVEATGVYTDESALEERLPYASISGGLKFRF